MVVSKNYNEKLKKKEGRGGGDGCSVEMVENLGEEHCFHLFNLKYEKVVDLINKFVAFIKQQLVCTMWSLDVFVFCKCNVYEIKLMVNVDLFVIIGLEKLYCKMIQESSLF